jgi:hypothetical protein
MRKETTMSKFRAVMMLIFAKYWTVCIAYTPVKVTTNKNGSTDVHTNGLMLYSKSGDGGEQKGEEQK